MINDNQRCFEVKLILVNLVKMMNHLRQYGIKTEFSIPVDSDGFHYKLGEINFTKEIIPDDEGELQ